MASEGGDAGKGGFVYPEARRTDVEHTYAGGAKVADPYSWLEDPDSAETGEWVAAQNKITDAHLAKCEFKDKIRARFDTVYNYEKLGCPFKRGDRWYWFRNDGLQNQSVLYAIDHSNPRGPLAESYADTRPTERVLLDLNALNKDGTTALKGHSFSEDGALFAYGLSEGGSDWCTLHVKSTEPGGAALEDQVRWVKFSNIAWTHDNKGFFYCCYPAPKTLAEGKSEGEGKAEAEKSAGTEVDANEMQMVKYHRIGTKCEDDVLVFSNPEEPKWRFGVEVSDDGKFLIVVVYDGCDPVNRFYYADIAKAAGGDIEMGDGVLHGRVVRLIDNFDAEYEYIANDGRTFHFKTNLDAPRYRLLTITLPEAGSDTETDAAALAAWPKTELVPQHDGGDVLEWASCVGGNKLALCYLHDVCSDVRMLRLDDLSVAPRSLTLPAPGSIAAFAGRRRDSWLFFKFTSFLFPGSIFRLDFEQEDKEGTGAGYGAVSEWYRTAVPGFDADAFVTTQEFATSKDGTKVPFFTVKAKPVAGEAVGPMPCLLYGYGGFNISISPYFSSLRLVWLQQLRGALVVANIRGGGEYGEEWHKAGALLKKQNCFDDFCAVGDHLVAAGTTTPKQLCIQGGSNGGLLVLACSLQRPDLFAAGVSQVPVADMLRFHKFTIGHAWCTDYGNAEESEDDFKNLLAYSPLHNVKAPTADAGPLPALLLTTGDHDDRVVPLHSFKMLATLQAVAGASPVQVASGRPLIARIETKAGHGAGKPTSKILDEYRDVYAFVAMHTGATWHED